jgi:hypothetical protein
MVSVIRRFDIDQRPLVTMISTLVDMLDPPAPSALLSGWQEGCHSVAPEMTA